MKLACETITLENSTTQKHRAQNWQLARYYASGHQLLISNEGYEMQ